MRTSVHHSETHRQVTNPIGNNADKLSVIAVGPTSPDGCRGDGPETTTRYAGIHTYSGRSSRFDANLRSARAGLGGPGSRATPKQAQEARQALQSLLQGWSLCFHTGACKKSLRLCDRILDRLLDILYIIDSAGGFYADDSNRIAGPRDALELHHRQQHPHEGYGSGSKGNCDSDGLPPHIGNPRRGR